MTTNKTSEATVNVCDFIKALFDSDCDIPGVRNEDGVLIANPETREGHDWEEEWFCMTCFETKIRAVIERSKRMEEALQEIAKDGQMIFGFGSTKETLEVGKDLNSKIKLAQDTLAFDPLSE